MYVCILYLIYIFMHYQLHHQLCLEDLNFKQSSDVFCMKGVLKNSEKLTGKHLYKSQVSVLQLY